ncbi:hypothetical protein [Wenjunlia tyrosinilytica]|uniref:Mce-associated membrane protein n=1 Tax=Wenjunlia tyrosinilytica TaxID=1544741 RepID=A0A918E257_9ACTN|nr:hypothetical protein [Wenjunlia tyrosinilytica]GGO98476.1 hypothetical protein GCM10012280_62710 [Wenjunlia tyrosinilytica]
MSKLSVRERAGSGTPRRRGVAAAARAAARRTERAHRSPEAPQAVGAPEASRAANAARITEKEPSTAGADAAPAGRRRGLLSAVLAILVVAALAATGVLAWQYREAERTRQARTQALAAARKAAPVIMSYDYRRLDRDFAAARGHLTGAFREKYRKTTEGVVAPTARKYHGVVRATVAEPPTGGTPAASVVSASPDRVVVLLFMNQVTNSTQVTGPRLDLNRVRLTLVPTPHGWKITTVDAL